MPKCGQRIIKMQKKDKLKEIVRATETIAMECDFIHMKRKGSEEIIKKQLEKLGDLLEGESFEAPVKMLSLIMRKKDLTSNTPLIQGTIELVGSDAKEQLGIDEEQWTD